MKTKIQTISGIGEEAQFAALTKIARFCATDTHENPWDGVKQKIECKRGLISPLNFHNDMRAALGDEEADLVVYNGGAGAVYLSNSPAEFREDGTWKIAIIARRKNENMMTLPDIIEIPDLEEAAK